MEKAAAGRETAHPAGRISLNVAQSMAFAGELVDIEEEERQHLEFIRKHYSPHLVEKEKEK